MLAWCSLPETRRWPGFLAQRKQIHKAFTLLTVLRLISAVYQMQRDDHEPAAMEPAGERRDDAPDEYAPGIYTIPAAMEPAGERRDDGCGSPAPGPRGTRRNGARR